MRALRILVLGLLALAALLAGQVPVAQAATFTVDSTGDGGDSNTADSVCNDGAGNCTLRAAIEQANSLVGTDTINFSIGGVGVPTISPGSALPTITDPVVIDGTTEGTGMVELDGSGAGVGVDGLNITAGSSTVKGLVINSFGGDGIEMSSSGGNTIEGNYIGTDVNGTADLGNSSRGVYISDAPSNTIGGTTAGAGNVISGNDSGGVVIVGSGATGNVVQGNYIGTQADGASALGNGLHGVFINSAPSNTIGGTTAAARNIISGNGQNGIRIIGSGATLNEVLGNYIGTDVTGSADLGNSSIGVYINNAPTNTVGGTAAGAGNVISGNDSQGVIISGSLATGNQVQGNYIGTDVSGTADLGNSSYGVIISEASSNTIGGTASGAGNVISGNDSQGVIISGSGAAGNEVLGNYIGTDVNGTVELGNATHGVYISDAPSNTIGGTTAAARNVISGNGQNGVFIIGGGATGNEVLGNYIGTDVNGTADLGNASHGVYISGAPSNTIGGTTAAARNVISGNDRRGVYISSAAATGNQVQGNYIGTAKNGSDPLGNSSHGVVISTGASDNTIGGAGSGEGNTIAHNTDDGVRVDGPSSTGNTIRGNSIHSNGGKGIENVNGGNSEMAPPVIDSVGSASGHTDPKCYPCTVEVFSDDEDEGRIFHGSAATNDDATGTWSYASAVTGPHITATVTDAGGTTSELSLYDTDGDGVGNGFPDAIDNCPDHPNPNQENDVHPLTFQGDHCEDADADTVFDITDNCPDWFNQEQELPPWSVPPDDPDCDGFDTTTESFMGTLPLKQCGDSTANNEHPDPWATDSNDDTWSKLDDVLRYIPVFNTFGPNWPYNKRFDLNADNKITLVDVLKFIPFFNRQCTP